MLTSLEEEEEEGDWVEEVSVDGMDHRRAFDQGCERCSLNPPPFPQLNHYI
jgi:hypothetical protein